MTDKEPEPTDYAPGVDLPPPPEQPAVRWWFILLCLLFILGATALIVGPNFVHTHGGGELTACKSNCKNLATALEMYASDNQDLYPASLAQLTQGNYLKTIPTCPGTGKDTYSGSYTCAQSPANFTFYCAGLNHAKHYTGFNKDSTNYPQYTSQQGLVDHP